MRNTYMVNPTGSPIVAPRQSLPPPALALDLMDVDHRVGWVNGDVVGFRGFGSVGEAAHAAWVAHRTLARRLDRRAAGGRQLPLDPEPLTIARRGDRESILAAGRPVATLLRPGARGASGPDSFGFEIRIQAPTNELTMRAAAHLVYRTLRRSGLRWTMWSHDAMPEPPPADQAPRREPHAAVVAPPVRRAPAASLGATLLRLGAIALIVVLVALAARPFAVTQPITLPVAVVAFAGLGAAAVGEANRRWGPHRVRPARRAAVADGQDLVNLSSRRAV